jgi:cytosine/uracil/thiamine/allantoin permease
MRPTIGTMLGKKLISVGSHPSATSQIYGVVFWNPVTLLKYAPTVSYTPAYREATFFTGLEILFDQVMLNLT